LVAGSNPVSRSILSLNPDPSNPLSRRRRLGLGLSALVWVLPLWTTPFPPMLDYPQQLAVAAMLRWMGDPVRGFSKAYEPALWHPQGLFEMVTATLAWLLPIEVAGKLVVSLSLAAVLPTAMVLCRRAGRPEWYGLLALAVTYNHVFFWGFVDSLIACPLFLGGLALADRIVEERPGWRGWCLLAGLTPLFYTAHLQMLFLFAGAVGWLALVRQPPLRTLAFHLSALLPGAALGAGVLAWVHLHSAEVMTGFQRYLDAQPTILLGTGEKAGRVPGLLFGVYSDGTQEILGLILAAVVLILGLRRLSAGVAGASAADREGLLVRTRFATLAGWILLLFFLLPEFASGYLVSERLVPLAAMVMVAGLPRPSLARRRVAAVAAVLLLALQLSAVLDGFRTFGVETAGLRKVLDAAEPGQALAGLMFEQSNSTWMTPADLLRHFPAYYQVEKGGRVALSFALFFNAPVRYRPGAGWEEGVLARWPEADAWRFDFARDGARFRYFLVRGSRDHLARAFGPHLARARVTSSVRWHLVDLGTIPEARQQVTALSSSRP
jgi:hypothetical protein